MKISFVHLPIDHLSTLYRIYQSIGSDLRLVGGCVRDTLLGRTVLDIDLATPLPPDEGMAILKANQIHVIPTGLKHGTITAILDHHPYEITTLRHDVQTYGRHADVSFSADWHEDANRRDFTINGLYAHIDSGFVEDYHHGLKDLSTGTIRFIGNAEERIREDYLRILRYFRFYAWYGQTTPTPDLLKTIENLKSGLNHVARERIRGEFLKLLKGPRAKESLAYMISSDVILHVSSLPINLDIPWNEVKLTTEALLYGLFIKHQQDIDHLCHELRLSNKQRSHMGAIYQFNQLYGKESLTYLIYLLTPQIVGEGLLLRRDSCLAHMAFDKKVPSFPVSGTDLHIAPGPHLGIILKACQKWWADHDFQPQKQECLTWIKNYLETSKR